MALDQFGNIAGSYVSVDGHAFNGVAFLDPTAVDYVGPEQVRALSGRPYLRGWVSWKVTWEVSNLDTYQTLYTIYNLKLNTDDGPRVEFGLNDPRNAGAFMTYTCWMSEPQFTMSALFVRQVEVTFDEVVE